jgi:hypothetical protein
MYCMEGGGCMLGRKVYRFCPVKARKVVCDGLCKVVYSVVVSPTEESVHICPVWEEAFDLAANCR